MDFEHIKGDTWCIVTGYSRIPFYKLDRNRIVMLDSGQASSGNIGVSQLLKRANLTVTDILTSHCHADHVGNHAVLQREHGAKLWMSIFDAAVLGNALAFTYVYGSSYKSALRYAETMLCKADELIEPDKKTILIEDVPFQVLSFPGHAPEHLCFVTPDNVAYVGDLLMSERVINVVRIPHAAHWSLDFESKLKLSETNYSKYIMAHNEVCDSIEDLVERNINVIKEKIEKVYELINGYMTMEKITAAAMETYGIDTSSEMKIAIAGRNIRAFVEYLLDTGKLVSEVIDGMFKYNRTEMI